MDYLWALLLVAMVAALFVVAGRGNARQERRLLTEQRHRMALSKSAAEADLERFGEELKRLELDAAADSEHDDDYRSAVQSHQRASAALATANHPEHVRAISEILEDGRYVTARVAARAAGQPAPAKRPPCFFNPAHGPSSRNVSWTTADEPLRSVPACAADAERVLAGADPYIRTVQLGNRRVPYWHGGSAYAPWVQGYYAAWRGSALISDISPIGA